MAVHFVEGALIADRFRLMQQLGRGGMGEVWLARHMALDVLCAVKFIYPEAASSPELRARFALEAKAAAQLRSSHVVQILDTGLSDGAPYIAMEYLEGEDLRQRLVRENVLDPRQTAAIIDQVARALTRAHAASLVHRDLKPANIFLCREDDRDLVKVLDFGVAKRTGGAGEADSQTETGALLGTPVYMSPEQAQGKKNIDHRSDLWALGVIAFRCLTGQLPFQSRSLPELLTKIVVDPLPIPSQLAAVPPGFDSWWARASSRNPDHRFQSAKDLAETLHVALGLSVAASKEAPSGTFAAAPAPKAGVALRDLKRMMPMDLGLVPRQPLPPPAPPLTEVKLPTRVLPRPVRGPVLGKAEVASAGIAPAGSGEVEKRQARGTGRVVVIAAVLVFLALVGLVAVYLLRRPWGAERSQAATPPVGRVPTSAGFQRASRLWAGRCAGLPSRAAHGARAGGRRRGGACGPARSGSPSPSQQPYDARAAALQGSRSLRAPSGYWQVLISTATVLSP